MDLLRLPPTLRSSILSSRCQSRTVLRHASTQTHRPPTNELPLAPPRPSSPALLTLTPATLNTYYASSPPNTAQSKHGANFFTTGPPPLLFSCAHFRSFPPSPHPEVAFLGRSNVGKSSLLNALFGRTNAKVAYVSKKPGKTRTMNGFGVGGEGMGAAPLSGEDQGAWRRFGRGGCVVVDMPGYGGGSRAEWGEEAMKYLERRKQLRRTFLLVDAEHGLKSSDVQLLVHLKRQGISHTLVLSKVDKLLYPKAKPPGPEGLSDRLRRLRGVCDGIQRQLQAAVGTGGLSGRGDILCCSAEKSLDERSGRRSKVGVDELRWAVLSACGLECDQWGQRKKLFTRDVRAVDDEG